MLKKRRAIGSEIEKLEKQIVEEKRAESMFMMEGQKINYLIKVEKRNKDVKLSALRHKSRDVEDADEMNKKTKKAWKQRIKYLLYENLNELTELKTENEVALQNEQDRFREGENELKLDKRQLHIELKELEIAHGDALTALKQDQDMAITELRQTYERKSKEIQQKYERRMKEVREEIEQRRKEDIKSIETMKDQHISDLLKQHEVAFQDIKLYYQDITHTNLDLIMSLKDDVKEMKMADIERTKKKEAHIHKNKKMTEPLQRTKAEVVELQKQVEQYEKDKEKLEKTKSSLLKLEGENKDIQWEHEVLIQRLESLKEERDVLRESFYEHIYEVQQKTGFKNLLLEKQISAAKDETENFEAQLEGIKKIVGEEKGDPHMNSANKVLADKQHMMRELEQELLRVQKLHNGAINFFEKKMNEYGIPKAELGFVPQRESV